MNEPVFRRGVWDPLVLKMTPVLRGFRILRGTSIFSHLYLYIFLHPEVYSYSTEIMFLKTLEDKILIEQQK